MDGKRVFNAQSFVGAAISRPHRMHPQLFNIPMWTDKNVRIRIGFLHDSIIVLRGRLIAAPTKEHS